MDCCKHPREGMQRRDEDRHQVSLRRILGLVRTRLLRPDRLLLSLRLQGPETRPDALSVGGSPGIPLNPIPHLVLGQGRTGALDVAEPILDGEWDLTVSP